MRGHSDPNAAPLLTRTCPTPTPCRPCPTPRTCSTVSVTTQWVGTYMASLRVALVLPSKGSQLGPNPPPRLLPQALPSPRRLSSTYEHCAERPAQPLRRLSLAGASMVRACGTLGMVEPWAHPASQSSTSHPSWLPRSGSAARELPTRCELHGAGGPAHTLGPCQEFHAVATSSLRASNSSSMGPAAARWRASEASAQCAAFCPLMNIAPKVGPIRGQPSSSATCVKEC